MSASAVPTPTVPTAARDVAGPTGPRSLAEQLRGWPDPQLAELLEARPDLATPAPQDSGQLASRASTRASVLRALDSLTRLELVVLDALAVLGGRAADDRLLAVVNGAPRRVEEALDRVGRLALVWGTGEDLRLVSAVADTLGSTVSGLGASVEQLLAPAGPGRVAQLLADLGERSTGDRAADVGRVAEVLGDPARVERLLGEVGPAAEALLRHLESSGAAGSSDTLDPTMRAGSARTPAEHLTARGLLLPKDARHLAVPREVALALRGGRTTHEAVDEPPSLVTSPRAAALVDQAAAGAAHELLHRTELLLEHWSTRPPVVLRHGGLAVRDLRGTAATLGVEQRTAALLVEVAMAAGLVAQGDAEGYDVAWLPTDASDLWRIQPPGQRWARLAEAWLGSPRLAGAVGSRIEGRGVNALAPDLERPWLPDTRRMCLREVGGLEPGCVLAAGTGVPSLVSRLGWLRPRRPVARSEAVGWVVEEAAVLGVLGLGGLSRHGRALLETGPAEAAAALEPLLPAPVDHVLLQADLTAVAPGPLEDSLARRLATVAQVESRGGATVYRFTEQSVRHAFDVGWSAGEIHEVISRASRTEVPQPLRYLVDDVARRFGTVRVGIAEAFLRSDDEAALTALVHDPRAEALGLRRLAPTVVVSTTPVDVLLPRLRELGVAPVVEGADGEVRVARPEARRARSPRQAPAEGARAAARTAATVTAIRAGDRAAQAGSAPAVRQTPISALATLRSAADAGATVEIAYVDKDGSVHDRLVDPRSVEGGWLRALDHRSEELRSFAVHRISAVRTV